jgi:ATP-dependent DNA helicase DinG
MRYILLDFETTGLSAENDEIIEVGALKMEGFEVIGTFQKLTRPKKPIPRPIVELTGITNEMVAEAPVFADIALEFSEFLEDLPIVAHNSQMEQEFLDHHLSPLVSGIAYTVHNSIELLALILPEKGSHSLESMRTWAKVEREDAHRAMADCEDLLSVMKVAYDHVREDRPWLSIVTQNYLQNWWWNWFFQPIFDGLAEKPNLFDLLSRESMGDLRSFQKLDEEREFPDFLDVPEESLNDVFEKSSGKNGEFQSRDSQKQMAHEVRKLLERGGRLAIEAPTGTGKSLGYLLPSFLASQSTDVPIVVTTHSKSLQDQLLEKDVPLAKGLTDQEYLQSTSVKGQENYLCLRKLYQQTLNLPEEESKAAIDERYAVAFLITFSKVSKLAELDRVTPYLRQRIEGMSALIDRVRSHHQTTIGPKCPFYESCHYFNSARLAHQSQVIIANHSLVFHWPEHLPKLRQVVFDEAHHLEDQLTATFSDEVSERELLESLERMRLSGKVKSWSDGAKISGFLKSDEKLETFKQLVEMATETAKEWSRLVPSLMQKKGTKETFGYDDFLNLNTLKDSPALAVIDRLHGGLGRLTDFLESALKLQKEESRERTPARDLITQIVSRYREIILCLERMTKLSEENDLRLLLWNGKEGLWRLKVFPIDVAPHGEEFFANTRSVVLTSATLSTGTQDEFYTKRIGIRLSKPLVKLPSPFDLEHQAKVFITPSVGNPGSAQHLDQMISFTEQAARILGGRTLLLLSANSRLKTAAEKLRERLEPHGITVFDSLTDKRAIEHFRETERAVLVGGERYGEGVDIPGAQLSLVVIEKINEMMTRGPLAEARKSRVRFGLFDYDFPLRMTWLKQRVGRLIRTATDRGNIVIFDPRYFGWSPPSQNVVRQTIAPMKLEELSVDQILLRLENDQESGH